MSHGVDATTDTLDEVTTPEVSAFLTDLPGAPVPGSVLDSLTLIYYQEYTGAIINGRNGQNVLQANGVIVGEDGKLIWLMSTADTIIVNDALPVEPHIAHFTFAYPSGVDTLVGSLTIRIPISNALRVP